MTPARRRVLSFLTASVIWAGGAAQAQTDFPSRPVHVVLPYPAGGIVDIATRIVTDRLAETWRQRIIVETKPGASGNIAWDQVARAAPDGYTWTFLGPATIANARMYENLGWSEKSFVPVGATVWGPAILIVNPSLPVTTLADFVDHARRHPGVLNWANPSTGASQHLNTAIFLDATKLDMVAVTYRGQPPAILDMIANRVQFMVASIGLVAQHIDEGKLKPLAIIGHTRSPLLPNVPTMDEAGYPEANVIPWYGFGVPQGTPRPVVDKIVAGINEAKQAPDVRAALEKQGLQPTDRMSTDEIASLYATDAERYARVIRAANIRILD